MVENIVTYGSLLLSILIIIYAHRIFFFFRGLKKLSPGTATEQVPVTIIIPARNEEKNIERCLFSLLNQHYPQEKLSIIVIDDQSTDATAEIVRRIAQRSPIPVLLVATSEFTDITSPKIRALAHGMQHASGSIILTTDADCIAPKKWVTSVMSYFDANVGVVTGLTVFEKNKNQHRLFWGIQFLDFLSYTAIAAGAIGWERMLISNGSNMAFRREAFETEGGFESLKHINSGDDSLLAQKITHSRRWRPRFALSPESTIITQPAMSFREMLHQRLRWVGQTAYYPPYMMLFMIATFVMFVTLTIMLPLTLIQMNIVPWIVVIVKFLMDYITMRRFTHLTGTREAMKYFIPTAVIHIPMILVATIGGYFFSFEWKDRTMKKESAS
ncbi:MAG: glycosyltransferase [Bacteroidota bacterium]